jgi:hypothetical protein
MDIEPAAATSDQRCFVQASKRRQRSSLRARGIDAFAGLVDGRSSCVMRARRPASSRGSDVAAERLLGLAAVQRDRPDGRMRGEQSRNVVRDFAVANDGAVQAAAALTALEHIPDADAAALQAGNAFRVPSSGPASNNSPMNGQNRLCLWP